MMLVPSRRRHGELMITGTGELAGLLSTFTAGLCVGGGDGEWLASRTELLNVARSRRS